MSFSTALFDLRHLNTFGLTSTAQHYGVLRHLEDLPSLFHLLEKLPNYFILGGGSNVILGESIEALVIHNQLKGIKPLGEDSKTYRVQVAAGENWHGFVAYAIAQGWYGLENLALIPGTVGAAPVQNIGAYGVEVKDFIESVEVVDLDTQKRLTLSKHDCAFAYRDSIFKRHPEYLVLAVNFAFPKVWQPQLSYPDLMRHPSLQGEVTAQAIFEAVCEIRHAKLPDPNHVGNAGSFFKNPIVSAKDFARLKEIAPGVVSYPQADGRVKLAAAWLIDQCGWKGRADGAVGVHDRQALVLVNRGLATARDVQSTAQKIQKDVWEKFAVALEPEPVFVEVAANSIG